MATRILGIDPGLQITGYAVVELSPRGPVVCEAGVIRSTEGRAPADMAPRLCTLYDGLVEVVDQFQPHAVAVEQLYAHYDHPRTAILMGHARGVIFLAVGQRGLPVVTGGRRRIRCSAPSSGS
jgi:crossover junction endodeoxyribonuclease RuvC